jgi:hypothetical protein
MVKADGYLEMRIGEVRTLGFRWRAPDLEAGETITEATITVLPVTGLTLGTKVIASPIVTIPATAVTANDYIVTFFVTTSAGNKYKALWLVKVV